MKISYSGTLIQGIFRTFAEDVRTRVCVRSNNVSVKKQCTSQIKRRDCV